MFDLFSLRFVILYYTLASACKEHMERELTPVFEFDTLSSLIKHASLLVHNFRTPIVPIMGDQLFDNVSDGTFALSFDFGVDDMWLLRVLGDVRREQIIFVFKEAVLSVCKREGPLLVRCHVGGDKTGVQVVK